MNKVCRCFWIFVKAYIVSPLFWLSVGIFVILCLSGTAVTIGNQDYSMMEVMMDRELYSLCASSPVSCDFIVAYGFDASQWFVVILPVLSVLPVLYVYDMFSTKLKKNILIRTSLRSYSAGCFLSAFITGMLVAFLGIALYVTIAYIYLPDFSDVADEYMMEVFGKTGLLRFATIMKKASNSIVISGIFAVFGLLIYHLVHDKFLTVTLPMMLLYLSEKGYILYTRWLYSNMNFESMQGKKADYFGLLFPSNCTSQFFMWENETGTSYGWFFVGLFCVMLIAYYIYTRILKHIIK